MIRATNGSWIDVSVPLHNGMVHWPGDAPFERTLDLRIANGDAANLSRIACSAHTGTHMDAPLHFIDGGESIDRVPLDTLIGPVRVIGIESATEIRAADLAQLNIAKGERVLFRTSNSGQLWQRDAFDEGYVGIAPDAAEILAKAQVRLVGVDYLSVGPFKSGNPETHRTLLGAGIWIIEGLDLSEIDPGGSYEMICLPLKIVGSDGAPARVVLRRT